jgi:hypothetical protein
LTAVVAVSAAGVSVDCCGTRGLSLLRSAALALLAVSPMTQTSAKREVAATRLSDLTVSMKPVEGFGPRPSTQSTAAAPSVGLSG